MDFGKKYMTRIFLYESTFFAANLFLVIVLLLKYFEILDLKLSLYVQLVGLYDVIYVLIVILLMLFFGAIVNQ